jgi:hypothetical protein
MLSDCAPHARAIIEAVRRHTDAGMVVGHRRETQTRGVWLWKNPVSQLGAEITQGKPPVSLVFFDTEGFESTGQSDAYDDRIFAFAAVIASTLIYNLAEAVRESDIEKLSFAVELANAFFPSCDLPSLQLNKSRCCSCRVQVALPATPNAGTPSKHAACFSCTARHLLALSNIRELKALQDPRITFCSLQGPRQSRKGIRSHRARSGPHPYGVGDTAGFLAG